MVRNIVSATIVVLLLLLATWFWLNQSSYQESYVANQVTPTSFELSTTTSTVHVAGLVTAVDTAVVSATANGVVRSIAVKEGSLVQKGSVLSVQDTPIIDAKLTHQKAVQDQVAVEQAAMVDERSYLAKKAVATAHDAEVIALLQTEAATSRVQEQLVNVRTELESSVVAMLHSLTFVSNNKEIFSDNKQEQFRTVVNNLYGQIPNHFRAGITYAGDSDTQSVLHTLEEMRMIDTANLSIIDTENLSVVVMGQIQALINLYTSAESNVLDRKKVSISSDIYSTYFANRNLIIEKLNRLESAQSLLQAKIDTVHQTQANTNQSVTVTALDEELATRQTNFSERIAAAVEVSTKTAGEVLAVEQSLSTVVSPFSGVVVNTLKEVGEYAAIGEPLLTIVGNEGRELTVSLPVTFVDQIKVGASFVIDKKIVGIVDRISPVSTGNTVTVTILLSDTTAQVGASLSGELVIETSVNSFLVPREYVFFSTGEPKVHDGDGQVYPVQIDYDNGDMFMLTFPISVPTKPLAPRRNISLK